MLNILNKKLKKSENKKVFLDTKKENNQIRHYPPMSQEWYNSIYAYNKNTLSLIPIADKIIINLIKSYFNFYSNMLNYRIKLKKLRIRVRRLSSHRIYVSKAEFKHTINKVIITIYIYNRQKYNFFNNIKKRIKIKNYITSLQKIIFKRKIRLIKKNGLEILQNVSNEKNIFLKTLKWKKNFQSYENLYLKNFIKTSLKKEMLHIYYKQILYFNKSKLDNTYLYNLTNLIKKIYNKNIEFNIINLKYFYLNSDIFSEALAIKLRIKKNRLLRVLSKSLSKVKLPVSKFGSLHYDTKKFKSNNLKHINTHKFKNIDYLERLLFLLYINNINKPQKNMENDILNSFKHKAITGVRLEATGRLSRRLIASRSVFKVKYKGSLKNIYSSYRGLSTVMLRGHLRSNLQYSVIKSKTRIGSFGLKGWVSSN